DEKQNRNCDGREKNQLLTDMNCRRRDKRSATHVVRIKRIAQPVWRESHRRGEPDYAHREIKSSRECVERPGFRIVDAAETIGLHQPVPDAPEKDDKQNSFQVPPKESCANRKQKQRRENKAPFKAIEQSPIAIGADHPRQVMSHRTECRDEEINILWT